MSALSSDARIAVIGGGKMGEAILGGWIASSEGPAQGLGAGSFVVADPGPERRVYLTECYGVECVADASEIPYCDIAVLAVKPQVMMGVLEGLADSRAFDRPAQGPLFVSIAAGLATDRLVEALPAGARLVRVMPNMPLLVGAGATSVCPSASSSESDVELVRDLFACLGVARVVDEADMDATCALSGSGPAYVAAMIEALRDAGARQGLDADLAETLALETVWGTCKLMKDKGQAPADVRIAVCSPGGTTLAALDAMGAAGFNEVFEAGVAAAVRRSKELSAC